MNLVRTLFFRILEGIRCGSLTVVSGGRSYRFGQPDSPLSAVVEVHDERFFRRVLQGGGIGFGESYMDGDWTSPDLVAVVRLAVRNLAALDGRHRWLTALTGAWDTLRHRLRDNTIAGSRRNIGAHYDLSNDFFSLFLDESLMYSCAFYQRKDDTLEQAQFHKLDRICRRLQLTPEDHVLEIGTGWGGFALHAARHYGCRITTTTISRRQFERAARRFTDSGLDHRIELLPDDYRRLQGSFDKIVSIEMFEAVGLRHYDEFFSACDRLLRPGGSMVMQTITIHEQAFDAYRRRSDWIQKYIFPGGELASVSEILRSVARATRMSLYHAEEIGTHYARTLAEWRRRFHQNWDRIETLGFDARFRHMWDFYLAYSEGAFLERHIGDFQIMLVKNHAPTAFFNEPWQNEKAPRNAVLAVPGGGCESD